MRLFKFVCYHIILYLLNYNFFKLLIFKNGKAKTFTKYTYFRIVMKMYQQKGQLELNPDNLGDNYR